MLFSSYFPEQFVRHDGRVSMMTERHYGARATSLWQPQPVALFPVFSSFLLLFLSHFFYFSPFFCFFVSFILRFRWKFVVEKNDQELGTVYFLPVEGGRGGEEGDGVHKRMSIKW